MQYSSKTENKKILTEFTLYISAYYMHLYLAREIFIYRKFICYRTDNYVDFCNS